MFSIANCLTGTNLFFGAVAIVQLWQERWLTAFFCIIICSIADLLDGWVARKLNQQSELGVQLDSLADVVSFGLFPAMVCFKLINDGNSQINLTAFLSFILTVMAAFRLARFNLKTSDVPSAFFEGVPTPLMGIFFTGLLAFKINPPLWCSANCIAIICVVLVLIFSYLMVSKLPIIKLLLRGDFFKQHFALIILLILSLISYHWIGMLSISLASIFWIIYSLINFKNK